MNNDPKTSDKIDDAVEKTFPASDPVNVGDPTGTEPAKRPVDRAAPIITKDEIDAAQRGEGHAHRDVPASAVDDQVRREKHHGLGDGGLEPDDPVRNTEVADHAGLGAGGEETER